MTFLIDKKLKGMSELELGKVPPHDVEAEQAVIGSMLTDNEAVT